MENAIGNRCLAARMKDFRVPPSNLRFLSSLHSRLNEMKWFVGSICFMPLFLLIIIYRPGQGPSQSRGGARVVWDCCSIDTDAYFLSANLFSRSLNSTSFFNFY